jgi:hypothetical protein
LRYRLWDIDFVTNPFRQESPGALLIAHLTQPPPDPREFVPDLPDQIVRALQRALAKGPDQRYATAGEFVQALRQSAAV